MTLDTPVPSAVIGDRYRLEERIGSGGMGNVFRGEDLVNGRTVAIKFLRSELAQNEELIQRLLLEATAVTRIGHPNVVEVLDVGKSEFGPFLVMDHLQGASAGAVLSRVGRFSADAAVATTIPVLEALGAAHAAGIVHRDLKPENVFLAEAPDGTTRVRLIDFGIAKMLDGPIPNLRTKTGVVYGTPDYLSPEQATGEVPLDGRSDLFATGVLLYELLTGARPFRAPTPVATAFRIVHVEAPRPSATLPVNDRLESIVMRLLQKKPADRFATARDVVVELERIVGDPGLRAAALADLLARTRAVALAAISEKTPRFDYGARKSPQLDATEVVLPLPRLAQRATRGFHVRGSVLRSIDRALTDRFGKEARDAITRGLPEPHKGNFAGGTLQAVATYEIQVLDSYLEAASKALSCGPEVWREIGRAAVRGELASVMEPLVAGPSELSTAMRRGVAKFAGLFSFGTWRVRSPGANKVAVEVTGFGPASVELRAWIVGMVEEVAKVATGYEVDASVVSGVDVPSAPLRIELEPGRRPE